MKGNTNRVVLTLKNSEILHASGVGVNRHLSALSQGLKGGKGSRNDWSADIVGAIGEYSICRWLGVFWAPTIGDASNKNDIPGFKKPIDVKTKTGYNVDRVFVSNTSPPEKYNGFDFIFCSYHLNEVVILGEIEAEEFFKLATFEEVKKGAGPCYRLDTKHLNLPIKIDRDK